MQLDAVLLDRSGILKIVVMNMFERVLTRLRHDGRLVAPLPNLFLESAACLQMAPFYLRSTLELSAEQHRQVMVQLLFDGRCGALFDPLWYSEAAATSNAPWEAADPVMLNGIKARIRGFGAFLDLSDPARTSLAR
ncbi:hypothetical protein GCM10028796_05330 [Ramlibacter monticola]